MSVPRSSRRFGWFVLVLGLMLWPRTSYADQQVYADFDGDGHRDHATFDPAHASLMRVWLSSNQHAGVLHSRMPLMRLAAVDLDGDGRPELVATDRRAGLHVWKAGGGRFAPYRHRRATTPRVTHRVPGRTVTDDPSSPDDTAASRPYGSPADLDACPPQIAWAANAGTPVLPPDRRLAARHTLDSSSPRAPPAFAS
jgi:hypothetical protein